MSERALSWSIKEIIDALPELDPDDDNIILRVSFVLEPSATTGDYDIRGITVAKEKK